MYHDAHTKQRSLYSNFQNVRPMRFVGEILFGRRRPTGGDPMDETRDLDRHGLDAGIQFNLDAGVHFLKNLDAGIQLKLDAGVQVFLELDAGVQIKLNAGVQIF